MRRLLEYNNPYINSSNCSCNILSILYASVEIGIVIFQQSSHPDVLLTPTCCSPRRAAHPDVLLTPTCCSPRRAAHPDVLLTPTCCSPRRAAHPDVLLTPTCCSPRRAAHPDVLLTPTCCSPRRAAHPDVLLTPTLFSLLILTYCSLQQNKMTTLYHAYNSFTGYPLHKGIKPKPVFRSCSWLV